MGQLVDEIITIIALGDTRHPDDPPEQAVCDAGKERPCR
jgi:hypothetical protein